MRPTLHNKRQLRAWRWLAICLLFGGLGCQAGAAGSPVLCLSSLECETDQQCVFGLCTTEGVNALMLHARVVPPEISELVEQHVPSLALAAGPSIALKLLEPVIVKGDVTLDSQPGTNIPGQIDARTPGDIPGLNYRFTASSHSGMGLDSFGYSIRVLPGRTYEVAVRPTQGDIPPHVETWKATDLDDGFQDILLPEPTIHVQGTVLFEGGEPITDALVVGLLDEGLTTGMAITDAQGLFTLNAPSCATSLRLQVKSTDGSTIFPDHITEAIALGDEEETCGGDVTVTVPIPELPMGAEPYEASLRLLAPDEAGTPTPVAGTAITILGCFAGGTLQRTITTDADGIATFLAIPGGYDCLVDVDEGSPHASWLGVKNLVGTDPDHVQPPVDITLSRRPRLGGQVFDAQGLAVSAGRVEATRRATIGKGGSLFIGAQTFETELADDGHFTVAVDPGIYDIRIIPELETGAPIELLMDVTVEEGSDSHFVDVQLPRPSVLHLSVAGPGDVGPLPGTKIELYIHTDTLMSTRDEDSFDAETPPLLVRAVTGEDGAVDLLIPFLP